MKDAVIYRVRSGVAVPRVSDVLGEWADGQDALMRWSARTGRRYEDVREAKARIGTLAHTAIAHALRGEDIDLFMADRGEAAKVLAALEGFRAWLRANVVEPIAIEEPIVSEVMMVGGTPDLRAFVNGKRTVVDWKTGSSLHPKHVVQLEGYSAIHDELFPDEPIEQRMLVRLDTSAPGRFEQRTWTSAPAALFVFGALRLAHQGAPAVRRVLSGESDGRADGSALLADASCFPRVQ